MLPVILVMIFYHDKYFHHHLPCRKPTFPVTNSSEQTPLFKPWHYIHVIVVLIIVLCTVVSWPNNWIVSYKYHIVPSRNFSWYANRQYRLDPIQSGPTFALPSDIQLEDLVLQRSELEWVDHQSMVLLHHAMDHSQKQLEGNVNQVGLVWRWFQLWGWYHHWIQYLVSTVQQLHIFHVSTFQAGPERPQPLRICFHPSWRQAWWWLLTFLPFL